MNTFARSTPTDDVWSQPCYSLPAPVRQRMHRSHIHPGTYGAPHAGHGSVSTVTFGFGQERRHWAARSSSSASSTSRRV